MVLTHMAEHVPEMAKIVCREAPVLLGLGTLENAYDRPAKIVAVAAESLYAEEPLLLEEAKSFMPGIMLNPIDVLIVDEVGKDISGDEWIQILPGDLLRLTLKEGLMLLK